MLCPNPDRVIRLNRDRRASAGFHGSPAPLDFGSTRVTRSSPRKSAFVMSLGLEARDKRYPTANKNAYAAVTRNLSAILSSERLYVSSVALALSFARLGQRK